MSRSKVPPRDVQQSLPRDVQQSLPRDVQQSLPRDVQQSFPRDVQQSFPRDVQQSFPRDVQQSLPRDVQQSLPRDVQQSLPRDVRQSFPREWRVPVEHQADVFAAQHLARRIAAATGFPAKACAELMIVASELASNVLKYGRRGSLRVEPVDEPDRGIGVRLVAEDEGPHFKSFETALLDGWSDDGQLDQSALIARRGTASGLGAVRRMTHELRWEPLPVGKAVIATRYLAPDLRAGRRRPVAR